MLKAEVKVGGYYVAKVSLKLTVVKILEVGDGRKGWLAENVRTKREVWITSAAKLRREVSEIELKKFLDQNF